MSKAVLNTDLRSLSVLPTCIVGASIEVVTEGKADYSSDSKLNATAGKKTLVGIGSKLHVNVKSMHCMVDGHADTDGLVLFNVKLSFERVFAESKDSDE